jgi:predicted metal-dependent enzyme (double-stranded beta helix superfamily)
MCRGSILIETIERKLEAANMPPAYAAALSRAIAQFDSYRGVMPGIPSTYSRTLLYKCEDYELVAMRWEPGSRTPIHDHGDSRCWVVMMDGAFHVDSYDRTDAGGDHATLQHTSSMRIVRGELDHRLGWRELHRVLNNDEVAAYSVQLYAAPIVDYLVIDDATGIVQRVAAKYDALYDLTI